MARGQPRLPPSAPLRLDATVGGPSDQGALRMVWLGDSTAAGVGSGSAEGALPRQVAARLGRPVELTVLAESGARVDDVLADQVPGVAHLRPDVVLISVGANDVVHLTTRSRFARLYRRVLDQLGAGQVVVALGVPDMGAVPRFAQPLRAIAGWRGRSLDSGVRGAARERRGVSHVDIEGRTGPAMRRDPDRYFAPDGYHPNQAGYGLWADAVRERLGALGLAAG